MNQEPVSIVAALNAAITATLGILLFVGVDPTLVGALTLAATAWIAVGAAFVRARVTPVQTIAGPDRGAAVTMLFVDVLLAVLLLTVIVLALRAALT